MDEGSRSKRIRRRLTVLGLALGVLGFCCCHGPVERLPATAWPEDLRADWGEWQDLRVAVHVHSEGSSDATGSVEDLVAAAKEVGIDVILLTDHDGRVMATSEGLHGEVLVIVGEEEGSAGGSHVLGVGQREGIPADVPHEEMFAAIREHGGLVVAAHPARGKKKDQQQVLDGADLVEVYSLSTDTFALGKLEIVGKAICMLFAPESTLESIVRPPKTELKMWDAQLASRPLTALGACDSHGKYGLDHALAFKLTQTHVLVRERTREAVLDALRAGRAYVTLEQLAPAAFFAFAVTTPTQRHLVGASSTWEAGSQVHVRLPATARLRVLRDGKPWVEVETDRLEQELPGPGVYRVEAWLGERLWLFSNAIRLMGRG